MTLATLGKNKKNSKGISNSTLLLLTFATAFFPRMLTSCSIPSLVNFTHFLTVPATVCIVLFTSRVKNREQIAIAWELILAMAIFLAVMIVSALINDAGAINVFLQFMFQAEPYLFLLTAIAIPFSEKTFKRTRRWLLSFCLINLVLALVQSVLLPLGLYPRKGGTIADNTAGVFASLRGSAGNYVSCTVSVYFALYLFRIKSIPLWIRCATLLASIYQVYISDSKQVFLALAIGWILLILAKIKEPRKLLFYSTAIVLCLGLFWWALYRFQFMTPYLNWIDRPGLYGPGGEATLTKLAAFNIIPPITTHH